MPAAPIKLHISNVQKFEILAGNGILVAFAQEANVVGIFQLLKARGIPSSLFDIAPDGAGVLHAAMDHFLFALPPHLESYRGSKRAAAIASKVTNNISMRKCSLAQNGEAGNRLAFDRWPLVVGLSPLA